MDQFWAITLHTCEGIMEPIVVVKAELQKSSQGIKKYTLQAEFSRRESTQVKRKCRRKYHNLHTCQGQGFCRRTYWRSKLQKILFEVEVEGEFARGQKCRRICWALKLQENLLEVEIVKVVKELLEGKIFKKEGF